MTIVLSIALAVALLLAGAAVFLWLRARRRAAAVRATLESRVTEAQEERQRFGADIVRLSAQLDQKKADYEEAAKAVDRLEDERDRLRTELVLERAPVRPPRDEDAMNEGQLREAFDVETENSLWLAVHQVLDARIVEAVDDVAPAPSPVFSGESRTHSAGGLNSLRDFQKELLQRRRDAMRAKVKAKGEGAAEADL